MNWFETKKEARKEADKRNGAFLNGNKVWKWKHTKRKKPFFVGTYIEWLNK